MFPDVMIELQNALCQEIQARKVVKCCPDSSLDLPCNPTLKNNLYTNMKSCIIDGWFMLRLNRILCDIY